MYEPLTDWWKNKLTSVTEKRVVKDAGVKEERAELSMRLSPVVAVTSQFSFPTFILETFSVFATCSTSLFPC